MIYFDYTLKNGVIICIDFDEEEHMYVYALDGMDETVFPNVNDLLEAKYKYISENCKNREELEAFFEEFFYAFVYIDDDWDWSNYEQIIEHYDAFMCFLQ